MGFCAEFELKAMGGSRLAMLALHSFTSFQIAQSRHAVASNHGDTAKCPGLNVAAGAPLSSRSGDRPSQGQVHGLPRIGIDFLSDERYTAQKCNQ